jgi:hypothetical protein
VRSPLFGQLQLEALAGDGSSLAAAELLQQLRDLPDIEVQAKLADLIGESILRRRAVRPLRTVAYKIKTRRHFAQGD